MVEVTPLDHYLLSVNFRSENSHLDIEDYATKSLKNGGGHQTITQPPHNDFQESKISKIMFMNNNEVHGEDDDQPPHFNQESSSSSSDPKISSFNISQSQSKKKTKKKKRKVKSLKAGKGGGGGDNLSI